MDCVILVDHHYLLLHDFGSTELDRRTDQLILLDLHVQDFEEYLRLQSQTFVQYYRCLPLSLLKKENAAEDGNRGKAFCFIPCVFFLLISFSAGYKYAMC